MCSFQFFLLEEERGGMCLLSKEYIALFKRRTKE
jgi:hypothetical protein